MKSLAYGTCTRLKYCLNLKSYIALWNTDKIVQYDLKFWRISESYRIDTLMTSIGWNL